MQCGVCVCDGRIVVDDRRSRWRADVGTREVNQRVHRVSWSESLKHYTRARTDCVRMFDQ